MRHLYIRRIVTILGGAFILACLLFAALRTM